MPKNIFFSERCDPVTEECIIIKNCQKKLDILKQLKTCGSKCVSRNDEILIKTSICGFENRIPKVCCTKKSLEATTISTPTNKRTSDFDILNHPSLSLLPNPNECGDSPDGDRIVGGEETILGEWPWMALLIGLSMYYF